MKVSLDPPTVPTPLIAHPSPLTPSLHTPYHSHPHYTPLTTHTLTIHTPHHSPLTPSLHSLTTHTLTMHSPSSPLFPYPSLSPPLPAHPSSLTPLHSLPPFPSPSPLIPHPSLLITHPHLSFSLLALSPSSHLSSRVILHPSSVPGVWDAPDSMMPPKTKETY